MKNRKKIKAFTLYEMIVVLLITTIVVGMAFSVLRLVQKQMHSISINYEKEMELNRLRQSFWIDFRRYNHVDFLEKERILRFSNELQNNEYTISDSTIVTALDTFAIRNKGLLLFFDGEEVYNGEIDALKLILDRKEIDKSIFIYKKNSATSYMN